MLTAKQLRLEAELFAEYVAARDRGDGPAAGRAMGRRDRLCCGRRSDPCFSWTAKMLPGFVEAYKKARSGRGDSKPPYDLIVANTRMAWFYRKGEERGVTSGLTARPTNTIDAMETRSGWERAYGFRHRFYNSLRDYQADLKDGFPGL